jgi:hypothetical protein
MLKRAALVVVVVMVAAGCQWLQKPGLGPLLSVQVGPPAAAGARAVTVTASDLADGAAAVTRVHLDGPRGPVVATGTTLPLHFTLDVSAVGPGFHALFAKTRIGEEQRRGIGGFDDSLRLNQLQALGSHNSYHEYPPPPLDTIESLQYFHDPLDVQFQSEGVRQIELDVNVNSDDTFSVVHVQGIDENTTCRAFVDCLATIRTWSQAHPQHIPIAVLLELKDNDFQLPNLPFHNWTAPDLDHLDATIRSVFSESEMYTPDDLRGAHTTLPEAIATDGWPTLDSVRGQVMFVMDNSGTFRDWYRAGHPALAGRVVFTNGDPGADDAAFVKRNDSKGSLADIQSLIAQGYVIRTRTDADTVEARTNDTSTRDAAFASGATWVSTDYEVAGRAFGTPYVVAIPGGTPARCNPVNAPAWCTSAMVESLP